MTTAETAEQIPLPWQTTQWRRLRLQREANQLAHAYLLAGPAGLGKALFARQFARLVLCLTPNQKQACEQCRNCELSAQGDHPDIHTVAPEEGSKDIKIDQIRKLADYVVRTSHAGGSKVAIINHAHQMNSSAANALLKTLEEPTPGTYLFLISESPGSLSATIRSRCQRLQFHAPTFDEANDWLQGVLDVDADPVKLLAATNNRPLLAYELAGDDNLNAREDFVAKLCALLQNQQSPQVLVSQAMKFGDSSAIECLLETSTILIRRLLVEDTQQHTDPSVEDLLIQIQQSETSKKDKVQHLMDFHHAAMDATKQINSSTNPNQQLILESLIWQWKNLRLGISP